MSSLPWEAISRRAGLHPLSKAAGQTELVRVRMSPNNTHTKTHTHTHTHTHTERESPRRTCRTTRPAAVAFVCLSRQNVDCLPPSADMDKHDTCAIRASPSEAAAGRGARAWNIASRVNCAAFGAIAVMQTTHSAMTGVGTSGKRVPGGYALSTRISALRHAQDTQTYR